ncbi:MAG: hypothetical protein AABZ45_08985, partial [Pseudomonadota bacterium]
RHWPALQRAHQSAIGERRKTEARNRIRPRSQAIGGAAKTIVAECGVKQRLNLKRFYRRKGFNLDQRVILR